MYYVPIATKLLMEHVTASDQVFVRLNKKEIRPTTYLVELANPALNNITLQRISPPASMTIKVDDETEFSVQKHHLKLLLAKQRFRDHWTQDIPSKANETERQQCIANM